MGKNRFRFSDMLPNAWFYKLKDMSKTRTQQQQQQLQHYKKKQPPQISLPRYSYNFTTESIKPDNKFYYNSPVNPKASDTHFPDHHPSRKSSKKKNPKRKTIYKPSSRHFPSSSSESSVDLDFPESHSGDEKFVVAEANSCNCEVNCSSTDIIIDLDIDGCFSGRKANGFDTISELELPPILTKPTKLHEKSTEATKSRTRSSLKEETATRSQKEHRTSPGIRKSSPSHSIGIRMRANSPRIASKKLQAHARKSISSNTRSKSSNKSISESFVVVKSSFDPQRDFRESMVEMIVENNLRGSQDLEDLLACYFSLNSNEYHEVIVKAFEQVWLDITNLCL